MLCPKCKKLLNAKQIASARHCPHCGVSLTGIIKPGPVMHGKYTILRTLGKGGMGELYLASETIARHDRLVVVKEMLDYYDPKDPLGKARAQHRFETEAAALVSLSVAGVPQIFDYFTESGRNYIVMQFIEGQNLETKLTHVDDQGVLVTGRAYPVDQVRTWGVDLCRILQALTAKNIIHMDIKPANLILDPTGDIWLVDFGTVKTQRYSPPASKAGMKKSSVYGTLGYASPEQINGKAEPRSDVYALAATLYHLMTDDDPADPPGAFAQMGRLPDDVSKALQRALAVDVRQRVGAAEFGRLLALPVNTALPFHWRDGTIARQPVDLVATANRNWSEAQDYFTGGDWEKWLRSIHQNNLNASIQAIRSRQPDAGLALDEFLRVIDPAFPAPRLRLNPASLDAGMIPWKMTREFTLNVENSGSGCLKGRFTSLPAAFQVEPVDFMTHAACQVKVKIDTSLLSPSAQAQTEYLKVDAGAGGQGRLRIKFLVPEPELVVEGPDLDFGEVFRGEELSYLFQVSNKGDSPFLGEATSTAAWMKVNPQFFDCPPGEAKKIQVQVDTHSLSHAAHAARMQVYARAGRWDQVQPVQVRVDVSPWRTFIKHWLPPLLMITIVAAYGGFLGAKLGVWLGGLIYPMQNTLVGVLVGALFGALICAFPSALIGGLGGLGNLKGKAGAILGGRYGALAGVVTGSLAGLLVFPFLSWLGLSGPSLVFDFFGGMVGALCGGAFGGGLYFLSKRLGRP